MSIVMTGGGTGGHLAIIRAVKDKLKDRELVYIGSNSGQDRKWFESDSDFSKRYFLDTKGVVNQKFMGKFTSMYAMLKATLKTVKILKESDAKVVFSVGGYSSAPSAFAAKILGLPLVIHEQNAVSGTLNRLLKPVADSFICSFDEKSPVKAYPVSEKFFESSRVRGDIKRVIFLGGSQGALAINKIALKLAPELKSKGIEIIHQCGEKHIESIKSAYSDMGISADIFGFTDSLDKKMAKADFAIARAGASTLWELSANGLPALFIPYPYASGDHQYYNAKYLSDRDMGWVMRESEIDFDKILEFIEGNHSGVSERLIENTPHNGAEDIAKLLIKFAK